MNKLLRTDIHRNGDYVALDLIWEDTEAKSKWSVRVAMTNEQLDDLRVRVSSFQQGDHRC